MAFWRRSALGVTESIDLAKRGSSIDGYFLPPSQAAQPHYGPEMAITDPSGWLGMSGNDAGVTVTESSALGSTAFYRGVSVIASTLATLPLRTYRTDGDGKRDRVASILDDPCSPFFTPFEWTELLLVHLILHGNAYLLHLDTAAGTLAGLFPIHPSMVTPEWVCDASGRITGKRFKVSLGKGKSEYKSDLEITQIMGLGTNGLEGLSVLNVARNVVGTTLAGDRAAARMFSSGMLIGGLVTTDETLDEDDGKLVMAGLKQKLTGTQNAGDIAMVNASLKFTPWSMSADDAQFIESRSFQVEEISRLLGVPKVLLAEDGASSWGSGIGQLLSYMQKTNYVPWTTRVEQRLSLLLAKPRHCEFEYDGLLAGTPFEQTQLLAAQIAAGIIDADEARIVLRMPPRTPAAIEAPVDPSATGTSPLPATPTGLEA
jgi:HK97 family phage portal protein